MQEFIQRRSLNRPGFLLDAAPLSSSENLRIACVFNSFENIKSVDENH